MDRSFFQNLNDVRQRVAAQDYERDRRFLQDHKISMKRLMERMSKIH